MIDSSQLSCQSGNQQNSLDRLRTELFICTDKLEAALHDEQAREREIQIFTLNNQLKDTVSSLLEAAANNNSEQLKSILNEKMGEEFVNSYSDVIQRFHVDMKQQPSTKATPKPASERDVELPEPKMSLRSAVSLGNPSISKPASKKEGGGILKNVWGMFGKKESTSKPTQIILNENEPKHYYCERRKKYVIEGEQDVEDKPIGPPPKKSELKTHAPTESKKPETELDSMIAPPPFVRGKKKGPKQEKIIKQMVPEQLPPVMDFTEFRRKLTFLFDEAAANQQQAGCSTKAVEQFVEKLYFDFEEEEKASASLSQLMRDSYELLLSNSRVPPCTQITILTQNHSVAETVDMLPRSKAKIMSIEQENQRLKSAEMQYHLQRTEYEAKLTEYANKIKDLQGNLQRERGVLEERIREREKSVQRTNDQVQGRRFETERLQNELAELKSSSLRTQADLRQLKRSHDELIVQLSTKEAELQTQHSIAREYSDNLEQSRYELRQTAEDIRLRDSKIRALEAALRENEQGLNQYRSNEESMKRCYASVIKSKADLARMEECLRNQNILLEKIKKRRSNLAENFAANEARIQRQLSLAVDAETPPNNFLQMSSLVSDAIVRSTSALRDYQTRIRELIQELNTAKEEFTAYKESAQAKIKNLNAQVLKVKVAMDNFKLQGSEATAKLEILRKDKLRLEKELDKLKHDNGFSRDMLEKTAKNSGALAKKIEELTAELVQATREKEKRDVSLKQLQTENAELEEVIKAMEGEKEQLSEELTQEKNLREQSDRDLEKFKSELSDLRLKLVEDQASKEGLNRDYEQLYDSYNELEAQMKEQSQQMERATSELSSTKALQEENGKELTGLRQQLATATNKLAEERQKNERIVQDIEGAIAELEGKTEEAKRLEVQLEVANAKYAQLLEAANASALAEEAKRSEWEAQLARIKDEQTKQIQDVIEDLAKNFDKEREELHIEYKRQLTEQVANTQEQIALTNNSVEQMVGLRTSELTRSYEGLLAETKSGLEAIHDAQIHRLHAAHTQALSSVKAELDDSTKRLNEAEAVLKELDEVLQGKTRQLEEHTNELERVRRESLQQLQSQQQHHNQLLSSLSSQLEDKKKQVNDVLQDLLELKEQLSQEKQHRADCILAIKKHEQNEQTKSRIMTLMENDILRMSEERKGLEEIIGRLSSENNDLKYQIDASNEMNNTLTRTEVEELQSSIDELKGQLKENEMLIQAMNEDIEAKQAENGTLTKALADQKESSSMLSVRINQLISEMLQYKQRVDHETAEYAELQSLKGKMLEDHQRYEAEAAKMKEEIAMVVFQSEEMKSFYERKLTECNDRIADLTASKSDYAAEVDVVTHSMNQQLVQLKQENLKQFDAVKQLTLENNELHAIVADLRVKLKESNESRGQSEPVDEGLNSELEKIIEKQEEEMSRLQALNSQLLQQVEALERSSLQKQNAVSSEQINSLKSANLELQRQVEDLKKQQFTSSEASEYNEREAVEMRMILENMSTQLEQARTTITKVTADKTAKEREIFQLQSQTQKLKERVSDKAAREQAYQEKIARLQSELSQSKATEVKRLQERVRNLELENEQLLKDKVSLINSNDKLIGRLAAEGTAQKSDQPPARATLQTIVSAERPTHDNTRLTQSQPIPETPKPPAPGLLMSALSKLFLTSKEQEKLAPNTP